MKAKYRNSYLKASEIPGENPRRIYVYKLQTATKEEKEAFETAQGDNLRVDDQDNSPLFFTTRYAGEVTELSVTATGRIVAVDDLGAKLKDLFDTYGKDVGMLMAQRYGLIAPPPPDAAS